MKIYLIRHTSVDVPQSICYGQTNVPLKDTFEEEAEKVKQQIKDIAFDAVFSSPMSRCRKLARYCLDADIQLKDSLKEINFGDWEMKPWTEIDMSVWKNDWINNAPPNGESFAQMYERVSAFFDKLKDEDYQQVCIFAHGGIIACAQAYFDGIEMHKAFDNRADYGEIWIFDK